MRMDAAAHAFPDALDPSEVRRVVLRTIVRNPDDGFTLAKLSQRSGYPAISIHVALVSLVAAGLVVPDGDEYVSAVLID
jgi:DNA-binding IclR family transcriptional regulator